MEVEWKVALRTTEVEWKVALHTTYLAWCRVACGLPLLQKGCQARAAGYCVTLAARHMPHMLGAYGSPVKTVSTPFTAPRPEYPLFRPQNRLQSIFSPDPSPGLPTSDRLLGAPVALRLLIIVW